MGPKLLILQLSLIGALLADPIPFSQTMAVDKDPKSVPQATLISALKLKAVQQWVLRFVGAQNYSVFEAYIRSEIADRFVTNYQLGRLASDKNQWELAGKLDNDGLKRWFRLTEAKLGRGAAPKPVLIITSESESLKPETLGTQWIEFPLSKVMARFNSRVVLATTSHPSLIQSTPPRTPGEIDSFGEKLKTEGLGTATWVHLSQPEGSNGQIEFLYFTAQPAKLAFSQVYPFPFRLAGTPTKKLEAFIGDKMVPFEAALEDLIGGGSLLSTTFRFRITGLDSFAKFKKVDRGLALLDPITRVLLKAAESQTAEYEISSTLPLAAFYQKVPTFRIGDYFLKPENQDVTSITVRLVPAAS